MQEYSVAQMGVGRSHIMLLATIFGSGRQEVGINISTDVSSIERYIRGELAGCHQLSRVQQNRGIPQN